MKSKTKHIILAILYTLLWLSASFWLTDVFEIFASCPNIISFTLLVSVIYAMISGCYRMAKNIMRLAVDKLTLNLDKMAEYMEEDYEDM